MALKHGKFHTDADMLAGARVPSTQLPEECSESLWAGASISPGVPAAPPSQVLSQQRTYPRLEIMYGSIARGGAVNYALVGRCQQVP